MSLTNCPEQTFLHSDQIDALYTVYSSTQIKLFFDSQTTEIIDWINNTLNPELNTLDTANVKLLGTQTIAGVKTFSSSPIVPTPTLDTQAANKKYSDDNFTTKNDITTNRKLSASGDFTGTWHGYEPVQTDPGIQAIVNDHTSQLASNSKQVKPYTYIDYGIAFRSDDTTLSVYDNHASWAHGCVSYDESDDKAIVFYDVKPSHVLINNRVLMRKKDIEGNFSTPFVVANKIADGISCKTQASGIAKNGDYISLVAHLNNSNGNVLGTYIYRSTDKGTTWSSIEMIIDGSSVIAANGDVTGFLVLDSGRILSLFRNGTNNKIIYSDDNGATWVYASNTGFADNTEPAWCELSDGSIIAYLRKSVDGVYDAKIPAYFTKSTDGGVHWTVPVQSSTILDYTNSNGHLIFHKDSKVVEFIHHSRYMQSDGFSSLYVSISSEVNSKNDDMGEQIRISRLSPQGMTINGSIGDSGYVGACKSKSGVITVFYYNGTYANAQICYMVGYKSMANRPAKKINQITGSVEDIINGIVPSIPDYFEQGTIQVNIGSTDVLITDSTRLRGKYFNVISHDVEYQVAVNDPLYNVGVRQYDSDFKLISDSGWKSEYIFKTPSNASYIRTLIKKVDNSAISINDIKSNLFEIHRLVRYNKKVIYDNGNEHEFDTGLFAQVLTTSPGTNVKNSNNLELSFTSSTATPIASYITQKAINVVGKYNVKANVKITSLTGSGGASIRLYTKNNPTNAIDGRVGMTEVKVTGDNTIELPIPSGYTSLYVAVAVSKPGDGSEGSIDAKFFDIWVE